MTSNTAPPPDVSPIPAESDSRSVTYQLQTAREGGVGKLVFNSTFISVIYRDGQHLISIKDLSNAMNYLSVANLRRLFTCPEEMPDIHWLTDRGLTKMAFGGKPRQGNNTQFQYWVFEVVLPELLMQKAVAGKRISA